MELKGIVQNIIYRNASNGYTVLRVLSEEDRQLVTAVGSMPLLDVGDTVALIGNFTSNPRFGEQYSVVSYTRVAPSTENAIIDYLSSGAVRGVGPSLARAIVSVFGIDTLNVLDNDPDAILQVPGIGAKKASIILESYRANTQLRNVLIALEPYGVTVNQAGKIIQAYGDLCLAKIQENPYQLIEDIDGIGFLTADKIAQNVAGFESDSLSRLIAGIRYVLERARDEQGSTFLPRPMLLSSVQRLLGTDAEMLEDTVNWMIGGGELSLLQFADTEAVFLPALDKVEDYIARRLLELCKQSALISWDLSHFEKEFGITLSGQQENAVNESLRQGVLIITGGPGTGKTTIIQFIAHAMTSAGYSVALTAPTGRAANRMSEATGFTASTIHRLLEYIPETGFTKNETDPLLYDTIIVDEMSMVDAPLFYRLLKATPAGARLILVGDSDQLPPVGCGSVLLDMIRSGCIPTCRLTEIFRQAERSRIITNAHLINQGQVPVLNDPDSDFCFEEIYPEDRILARLTQLITQIRGKQGHGFSLTQTQVLSPMKSGKLGVIALNQHLQTVLNPPSHSKLEHPSGEYIFREGDRVMQIKNDYKISWSRYEDNGRSSDGLGVFNGDLGTLLSLDPMSKTGTIRFDDGRSCVYEYSKFDELTLAYCITIHKSQGSEFQTVFLPLAGGPPMLMTRNLLYTAVTRAKKQVYCVGRSGTIARMTYNIQKKDRFTSLAERLIDYRGIL